MPFDRQSLPLSTASAAARDAYFHGIDAKITAWPGAIAAFDHAIEHDPGFALAHVAKAHTHLERGDTAAARAAIAVAQSHTAGVTDREASHIAYFAHLIAGETEAALAALPVHLAAWPDDILVLATTAFTNGLIGSSGRAGQKRTLLALLDQLAPHYGDDAWFAAHHGMALSENGQHDAARPRIEHALAGNPDNPWAAHAAAHLHYETAEPEAACALLAAWLPRYPIDAPLFSHLSWHLALGHLELGETAVASALFRQSFAPDVHSGPPRGRLNDGASFLWRCELAGQPRDAAAWRIMHDLANAAFPRAGAAFSDLHVALPLAVFGDEAALQERLQQIEALAQAGRYPSGPLVPAVSRGLAAFARGDFAATIDALAPVTEALERIGGSHAQLDLVRLTLARAYVAADRLQPARALLAARRRQVA